jgi:hypothetical protein
MAGRYPSIILTRKGKAEAMKEQTRLLVDLTASISSMNAKLEDIHPAVLDLSTWKPVVERSIDALRAELSDLYSRIIDLARPPSTSTSPCGELSPPLPHADALLPTPPKPAAPAATSGGDDHGQIGHDNASNQRGYRHGDLAIPVGAPDNGTHRLPGSGYDPSEFDEVLIVFLLHRVLIFLCLMAITHERGV